MLWKEENAGAVNLKMSPIPSFILKVKLIVLSAVLTLLERQIRMKIKSYGKIRAHI